ncbi:hypothetical protein FRC12_022958 [Ceratobasidium sp. 428]|nr:hypothetical protein FRC12_022958 [Ceratobasidium sp. 428]
MLDFQPYSFATGTPFQPEYMNIEGRKLKAPSSGAILLANRLGLISSEALGGGKPPQQAIQAKATVLTSEYFLNDH